SSHNRILLNSITQKIVSLPPQNTFAHAPHPIPASSNNHFPAPSPGAALSFRLCRNLHPLHLALR
ncbi:MAG: hypothetical protein IJP65_02845, partial [Bacteroidales bacterium]|nr:hypothetical protein [Bacteroidales bacterium]